MRKIKKNKLVLGTVQFGMEYGISNKCGQPAVAEVKEILDYANKQGIYELDTASSYGSSEVSLGQARDGKGAKKNWRIITKTPHFEGEMITSEHLDDLRNKFNESREKLSTESVYGLLIHACDDLFKRNGDKLFEVMQQLKRDGLVKKVGVSLYSGEQIDRVLDKYKVDIVQLPINILDQRLIEDGRLINLKRSGVEIHARSVFLQGLLLMNADNINPWFYPIQDVIEDFVQQAENRGLTALELALGFVQGISEIDRVVVGVNTLPQLKEIVAAAEVYVETSEFSQLAVYDEEFINPSKWRV